ncbi:MAG: prepilin peptidase [Hydrogenophaga sp.]|nr:prepilin peptidase [Hydrogenophaga sp.]
MAVLVGWLMLVTHHDLAHRRVPNSLVLVGAAMALVSLSVGAQPLGLAWPQALLGGALAFGALLCLHAAGLMGAGDVKFAGALGLWMGAAALPGIWLITSVLGLAHALLWLALRRQPTWLPRLAGALDNPAPPAAQRRRHIPLAAYLAFGTLGLMALGGAG